MWSRSDSNTACRLTPTWGRAAGSLPNPAGKPEPAPQTGQDEPVIKYVLSQQGATDFLDAFVRAVEVALAGYDRTGRHFVLLAVGCTGGKHRSVVMAEQMAALLAQTWPGIQ